MVRLGFGHKKRLQGKYETRFFLESCLFMIDYVPEPDETTIGVYSSNLIKHVKNKLKKSRLLLLIPQKETLVSYFIVKRILLKEFANIKGVDKGTNF